MTGPNSPHYFSLKNAKKRPKNSAKNIKNIKNAHFCRASRVKFLNSLKQKSSKKTEYIFDGSPLRGK